MIVVNPTAGRARQSRLAAVLEALRRDGCPVTLRETTRAGEAVDFARDASADQFDAVVAAGGDGTIKEVLNGLAARDGGAGGSSPALGVLPLGTANVLAHDLGLPTRPADQAASLAKGPIRPVRFGCLADGSLFGAMVGAGFDAQAVAAVDLGIKRWIGKGAYLVAGLKIWFRRLAPLEVTVDGQDFRAGAVIVSKGPYYAGRFLVAPEARLEDGLLHVCLFASAGPWRRLVYGLALGLGRLSALSDYQVMTGRQVRIEGGQDAVLQGDGDIMARLPVDISLAADAVPVIFPK